MKLQEKEIKNILNHVEHKEKSKSTISKKFKKELIEFFNNNDKIKKDLIIEVACSSGNTTYILSHLFKNVIAVDTNPKKLNEAKKLCKDRNNITFKQFNAYAKGGWNFPKADIIFIDCVHDKKHLESDINNAIKNMKSSIIIENNEGIKCQIENNEGLIIFDDYGLFPVLKNVIDNYVKKGILEILVKLGATKGTRFEKTANKVMKDFEGIICKIKK